MSIIRNAAAMLKPIDQTDVPILENPWSNGGCDSGRRGTLVSTTGGNTMVRNALSLSLALLPTLAMAAPAQVHHSGRLLDALGNPIQGPVTLRFDLMDQATNGSSTWDQSIADVAVDDGYYSVVLDLTDGGLNGSQWLRVSTDDGNTELSRQPLASVPYALRTERADLATSVTLPPVAGGTESSACSAPEEGVLRYNSDIPALELCASDNGAYEWIRAGGSTKTIIGDDVSGRTFSDGSLARSCKAYLDSDAYDGEGSGIYIIAPVGLSSQRVQCDMAKDGGGWTLVFREAFTDVEDGPSPSEMQSSSGDPATGEGRINPVAMYSGVAATDVRYDLFTHDLVLPNVSTGDLTWFFTASGITEVRNISDGAYVIGGPSWGTVYHHKWPSEQGQISTNTTWDNAVILDYGPDTNHGWALWTAGNGTYKRLDGYQTPENLTVRIWYR